MTKICSTKRISGLFTPDECDSIVAFAHTEMTKAATIVAQNGDNKVNKKIRQCDIQWITPNDANRWIFTRIEEAFRATNDELYQFDLKKMEDIQYTEYRRLHHFKKHFDSGAGSIATRKLTISVQLSKPSDYWGGNLDVITGRKPTVASRNQGDAIIFPPYLLHEAHRVYFGTRRCLVAWMHGDTPLK